VGRRRRLVLDELPLLPVETFTFQVETADGVSDLMLAGHQVTCSGTVSPAEYEHFRQVFRLDGPEEPDPFFMPGALPPAEEFDPGQGD
jgi:hypothetical protein